MVLKNSKPGFTFGSGEVDDIAIRFEHVDLFNGLNWLNIKLLESGLQLLVICAGALVHLPLHPPGRSLGTEKSSVSHHCLAMRLAHALASEAEASTENNVPYRLVSTTYIQAREMIAHQSAPTAASSSTFPYP